MEEVLDRAEREGVDAVVAEMEKLHESIDVEENIQVCLALGISLKIICQQALQNEATRPEESQAQTDTSGPGDMVPPTKEGAPSASEALLAQGK